MRLSSGTYDILIRAPRKTFLAAFGHVFVENWFPPLFKLDQGSIFIEFNVADGVRSRVPRDLNAAISRNVIRGR